MAGLFSGLSRPPRQRPFATPQAAPGPGWMQMQQGGPGAAPAYGSDQWATQQGGPGSLLWRQIVRGMANSKNPLAILDPNRAGQFFSPLTIGGLAPRYQQAFARQNKGKK